MPVVERPRTGSTRHSWPLPTRGQAAAKRASPAGPRPAEAHCDDALRLKAFVDCNDRAHGGAPQPIAVQTLMASTIGATSCTRTTLAPLTQAASDERPMPPLARPGDDP